MRDILLTVVVLAIIPFIFRSPRLGAYVWAWLSMMNPHKAAYGFARSFPYAYVVALVTLISFLVVKKERRPFPLNSITIAQLLFLFWMSVTCFFALNSADVVFDRWIFVSKIQLMLFVTLMLVRGREQIEQLVWVVTASIGFFGVKGGIWTLMGGGSGRVWGPNGSMIEGNNELGLALVMLIPFMYYLYQTAAKQWLRVFLVVCIVTTSFSILGSQSRGAFVALVAMAGVLALKSKRPVTMSVVVAGALAASILFMPESWSGRMETIQSFEQDSSAMSRLYAWKTMWALALDRPLVGGGFVSDNALVFSMYAPERVGDYEASGVFVAHSIYFQALGEHGFPGLILYALIGLLTWKKAGAIARTTHNDKEFGPWVPPLMRAVQVSLAGFAVGGAFLSLAYFDLPYYVVGIVVLVDATLRERVASKLPTVASKTG